MAPQAKVMVLDATECGRPQTRAVSPSYAWSCMVLQGSGAAVAEDVARYEGSPPVAMVFVLVRRPLRQLVLARGRRGVAGCCRAGGRLAALRLCSHGAAQARCALSPCVPPVLRAPLLPQALQQAICENPDSAAPAIGTAVAANAAAAAPSSAALGAARAVSQVMPASLLVLCS